MKTKSFDGKAPPGVSLRRAVRALFCLLIITACLVGAVSAVGVLYIGGEEIYQDKGIIRSNLDKELPGWNIVDADAKTVNYTVDGVEKIRITYTPGPGTSSYGTFTITLTDADITGSGSSMYSSSAIYTDTYATVILVGENTLTTTYSGSYGIRATTLEIDGYGELTVNSANGYGLYAASNMTIQNATVSSNGASSAIYVHSSNLGHLTITNATVTAEASSYNAAIHVAHDNAKITITDGSKVTVQNSGSNFAFNKPPTFESDAVYVYAGDDSSAAKVPYPVDDTIYTTSKYVKIVPAGYVKKITYDGNGGSGSMSDQEVMLGESANLNECEYTKTGHTFARWNTKADGSGESYADQASFTATADTTLYAQWTANQYTITFENTGNSTINPITKDYGTPVTAPDAPTKVGYTFDGWSPAVPATMPAEDMTVTAQWTANEYTVKFDGNDATSGSITDLTLTYGQLVEIPVGGNHITKDGHLFVNWNTKADGTGTTYNGEQNTDFKDLIQTLASSERTFILYAQWAAETDYIVVFDGSSLPSISVTSGNTITKPEDPTKTGYDFDGWYKESTFEIEWDFNMDTVTEHVTTLHAKWTPIEYAVKFDANGGDGEMSNQDFTYDDEQALTANAYTRTGYNFVGWAESADGNVAYANEASVKNLNSTQGGITTLYAKWTINQYTITFADTGDSTIPPITQDYDTDVTKPANPMRAGYDFAGWDKEIPAKMPAYDLTVTAKWNARGGGGGGGGYAPVTTTYTVTFDANGGEGSMSPQTFVSGKEKELPLNTFTHEGFVFRGWAETADGDAVYVDGETVLVKKSQTLYAVWTELNPTVTPTEVPTEIPTGSVPTEPGKSPAPVLGMILGGLSAAVILRRK